MSEIGVVVIGRNEGDRLKTCLNSLVGQVAAIVYVDSGSSDGSVEFAQSLGVAVVNLDLSIPFTAARARNAGFTYLTQHYPQVDLVQFVDGDCEVVSDWLPCAQAELVQNPELAVVCGRRRERFPDASIYNQLCDIEWDTPVGDAKACGGDALMRVEAVRQVQGFNPNLIAGEEPELCVRLRQQGWKIRRINAEMTLHDAQMMHFSQWWKRTQRAGHAFAEGAWLHGHPPERHWVKESQSIWLWGAIIPLVAIFMAPFTFGLSLLLLLGYPILGHKIYRYGRDRGLSSRSARLYALFCVLGKFPNLVGQIQFHRNRLLGQRSRLIEYKA